MSVHRLSTDKKRWYFTFYYNKKKIKHISWKGKQMFSKAEALAYENECRSELDLVNNRAGGSLTVYELYDDFVGVTKTNLKESTLAHYNAFKKIYLPLIKNKSIWELLPYDINQWRVAISKIEATTSYKNRQLSIVKNMLQYGSVVYNLPSNLQYSLLEPLKANDPIDDKEKKKSLPVAEFERMVNILDPNNESDFYYYVVINVLYYTGLRIGELAALNVDDLKHNESGFYLRINKDYIRVNQTDYIQPPKNKNSVRKVMLDIETLKLINQYITRFNIHEGVLFKFYGEYLNQQRLRRVIKDLSKDAGLYDDYDIHPHSLRHSHASNLRLLGFDEFAISQRLGNTPGVVMSTYIHADDSEQLEIIKKIRQ